MSQKRALILGINGQDGSYLADILLEKGYDVHGIVRRNSQPNLWRIQHCEGITLHQGDVLDPVSIQTTLLNILPDEIYNEADQDHVGYSQSTPSYSAAITYGAVANLLEMVKPKHTRIFQPLSATMFGDAPSPQNEETPFNPQSPYAISKLAAYYLCKHYREKHGVFVSTAILFNHDSVRRQGDYLLHAICRSAVKIGHGDQETLSLKCSSLKVDIGCAREYMIAAWKMLQLDEPVDLCIGSDFAGRVFSFVQTAFANAHVPMERFKETGGTVTPTLLADSSKAKEMLEWVPKRSVYQIINELCEHYCDILYGGK